jgi:hypothetical protein
MSVPSLGFFCLIRLFIQVPAFPITQPENDPKTLAPKETKRDIHQLLSLFAYSISSSVKAGE